MPNDPNAGHERNRGEFPRLSKQVELNSLKNLAGSHSHLSNHNKRREGFGLPTDGLKAGRKLERRQRPQELRRDEKPGLRDRWEVISLKSGRPPNERTQNIEDLSGRRKSTLNPLGDKLLGSRGSRI